MHDREIALTCAKGILGTAGATIAASVAPWQEHIAWTLGILVAICTLVSLGIDIRRKLKKK